MVGNFIRIDGAFGTQGSVASGAHPVPMVVPLCLGWWAKAGQGRLGRVHGLTQGCMSCRSVGRSGHF